MNLNLEYHKGQLIEDLKRFRTRTYSKISLEIERVRSVKTEEQFIELISTLMQDITENLETEGGVR